MNIQKIVLFLILFAVITTSCSKNDEPQDMPKWQKYFDEAGREGCFMLLYPESGKIYFYNEQRCKKDFPPVSTFKILASLMSLEYGKVKSLDNDTLYWNEALDPVANRGEKLTMRQAYQQSSNWYYQSLLRKLGADTVEKIVTSIDCYGNMSRMGEVDEFWKDGSLLISAEEQIEFLRRLYKNELPFRQGVMDTVKELMIETTTSTSILRAKTGTAFDKGSDENVAWYIGMAQFKERVGIFVLNMKIDADTLLPETLEKRKLITKQILNSQSLYQED